MSNLQKHQKAILFIYIIAFGVGTVTHAVHAYLYDWPIKSPYLPTWINLYWASLLIADPIAIMLLLKKRNAGIVAAILIMVSDVFINSYVTYSLTSYGMNMFLASQSAFMAFVLLTASTLWKRNNDSS